MKSLLKDALVLFIITIIAGVTLGFVYEVTKDARAEQEEIKKNNAYKTVCEGNELLDDEQLNNAEFTNISLDSINDLSKTLTEYGYSENVVTIDEAVSLKSEGEIYGYIITVTSKEGYGGDIQFTVGFDLEGSVTGISMLSISETAGLGMKAKETEFLQQYIGKTGGNFVVNKDNSAGADNEIDAISSATITTRAVTKGVNAAYITAALIMNGGGINE